MDNVPVLELKGVRKSFAAAPVLNGIDLTVGSGEFITILGASGCGKTTLLRIVAGLEEADSGAVFLEGRDVTQLEPNRRNVNTVFQNYALFPHMTVGENIAYPLKLRRESKKSIRRKVADALSLVQLSGYENRTPDALSGGQKQRVAIARAVCAEPRVLLLDEPLGALDLNLRRQMQLELKKLQKRLGITFIYITHDQEEALSMSDRVAVMRNGRFLQIGAPSEIYNSPADGYTARFVGEANVLPAVVLENDGDSVLAECFGRKIRIRRGARSFSPGSSVKIAVRSECISLGADSENAVPCTILEKNFIGGLMKLTLLPDGETAYRITASRYGISADATEGERVYAAIPPLAAVQLNDDETEDGC